MVVRLASEAEKREVPREQLEAIGYGFLVPLSFVVSGIKFDLGSLPESTDALLRVPLFLPVLLFPIARAGAAQTRRRSAAGAGRQ